MTKASFNTIGGLLIAFVAGNQQCIRLHDDPTDKGAHANSLAWKQSRQGAQQDLRWHCTGNGGAVG